MSKFLRRVAFAALFACLSFTGGRATVPTNQSVIIAPTPSGFLDARYPTGDDGTAAIPLVWQQCAPVSVSTTSTGSVDFRANCLTELGSPSATITLNGCTLPSGFSFTNGVLSWATPSAGSVLCRLKAARSGAEAYSRFVRIEAIAPPSADSTAPPIPGGVVATNGIAQWTISFDSVGDVFEADGDAGSGVASYDIALNGTVVKNVPASPGLSKQLTENVLGAYSPTPSSIQSGADWTLTSAGDIDGTDDLTVYRSTQLSGDATMTVKVESITGTTNFEKHGPMIRSGLAPNASFYGCYAYKNSNGSVRIQVRKRTPDGGNASSPVADITGVSLPLWLRESVRTDATLGELYTCEYSSDGNAFTVANSDYAMSLGATKYWGMFGVATTASGGATSTSVLRNFNLNNVGRLSVAINGITPGTATVRARDLAGNVSAYSAGVAVAPAVPTDTTPPTFTVSPSGSSGGQNSINWSCGTATDANGIRGYIPSTATAVGGPFTDQPEQASNAYTQSGLSSGLTYYLRCYAVDPSGNVSAPSVVINAATSGIPPPAFTAPVVSSVTAISQSALRITHTAVEGAELYELQAADNANGPFTILPAFEHTSLVIDRTGLLAGQTGCYKLRANLQNRSSPGPWSTTALCGTTQTAAQSIKWHPGHYLWITQSTLSSANVTLIKNQISAICSNANIKGVQLLSTWASLEGPTLGNYSAGFAAIDSILTQLQGCNKRLMLGIKVAAYGIKRNYTPSSCSDANFTWVVPSYVLCSAVYGNAGPPYGVAFSGNAEEWSGGLLSVAQIYTQPVMDRLIALSDAYSKHVVSGTSYTLDTHPNFEMLGADETALDITGFNYSHSALITQLKRRLAADAIAWPHTQIRVPANYTGSDAMMADLFSACLSAKNCVAGGPDPELSLPLTTETVKVNKVDTTVVAATGTRRTIQANEIFRGNVSVTDDTGKARWKVGGGTDLRGRLHFISEVQNLGLNDRVLTSPVSLLQDEATDGMRAAYMIWIYGGRSSEVISQINSDPTLYTTSCPTNFVSCNTN